MSTRHSIGVIYPGHAAEGDYPAFERAYAEATREDAGVPELRLPVTISTIGVDEHTPEALLETGSAPRLQEAAQRMLVEHPGPDAPQVMMWACTSGSFVYGWEGAHRQAENLAEVSGMPSSSTSIAFAHAIEALQLSRVAVAATYPPDLAQHFRQFLAHSGAEVVSFAPANIFTAGEVGHLGLEEILAMARAADTGDAEAVLIPDTAMHSLLWIRELEEALGNPVLTANQVTVWEGLRLGSGPSASPWRAPIPLLGALGSTWPAGVAQRSA